MHFPLPEKLSWGGGRARARTSPSTGAPARLPARPRRPGAGAERRGQEEARSQRLCECAPVSDAEERACAVRAAADPGCLS